MKPVIAITPSFDIETNTIKLNNDYANAVLKAGGAPILLSYNEPCPVDEIIHISSGIIFTGGGDIHAKYFGEELDEKASSINITRDEIELELCKKALKHNLPILGICRGEQVLNVACGGGINQHIEGHFYEENKRETVHEIYIAKKTLLYSILKKTKLPVNSIHHQAVGRLGDDLIISAITLDKVKVIEAIEAPKKRFVVGVQWHPELLFENNEYARLLFEGFINSCMG